MLGRRAARARDRTGAAAVRALTPLRVHARAPLLPRPRQQLRRPGRPHGVGSRGGGAAARRDTVRLSPTSLSPTARPRGATAARARARRAVPDGHALVHRNNLEQRAARRPTVPSPPQAAARGRPARSRRARHRRGARDRARGLGQDPRADRALPPARRPRLEPGLDHRGRVQRAGQGHDAGAPRRPARRRAPARPHLARARQRRAAPRRAAAPRSIDEWEMRRRIEALVPGQAARQHRHVRALSRSARRGAARARRPQRRRGPARRRRRLRRDVRRVPRQAARRSRDRPRRADLRRDRGRSCGRPTSAARSNARRATCSSTNSRTSPPRSSCSCASSPRPPTTSSASATTIR